MMSKQLLSGDAHPISASSHAMLTMISRLPSPIRVRPAFSCTNSITVGPLIIHGLFAVDLSLSMIFYVFFFTRQGVRFESRLRYFVTNCMPYHRICAATDPSRGSSFKEPISFFWDCKPLSVSSKHQMMAHNPVMAHKHQMMAHNHSS